MTVATVIPLFNAAPWIEETLRSVQSQTIDPALLEILVVDDGSTDGSLEIAERVLKGGPHRFQLLRTARKRAAGARNAGWRASSAQWIQFLDADDLLTPSKIAFHLEISTQCASDIAVIHSPWQKLALVDGTWQKIAPIHDVTFEPDPETRILESDAFVQLGASLFSRTWLQKVEGFDERCAPIEDVNLMLRIAFSGGKFKRVPSEPVLFYRQLENSISRVNPKSFIENLIYNAQVAEAHWFKTETMNPKRRELVAGIYFYCAQYYAGRDWSRFRELEAKLNVLYPGFVPRHRGMLRTLSQLIGYGRAEKIATVFRRFRQRVQSKGTA